MYPKGRKLVRAVLFLLLILVIPGTILSITEAVRFNHITGRDGLPQSSAHCIFQDSKGFLWIGTEDGLARYDGYRFDVYKNQGDKPDSISDNTVWCIFENTPDSLWIGTENGLNHFDTTTEKFSRIHIENNPKEPKDIRAFYVDPTGTVWLAVYDEGIYILDPNSKKIEPILMNNYSEKGPKSLAHTTSLHMDAGKNLWIGTEGSGLIKYDTKKKKSRNYLFSGSKQNNNIWSILHYDGSTILLGTGNGIKKFDTLLAQEINFTSNKSDIKMLLGKCLGSPEIGQTSFKTKWVTH